MTTPRTVAGALALAAAVVLAACGSGSSASSASFDGVRRLEPLDVSGVDLVDARDGSEVPIPATPGEITLVYFGYTSCPDVCPTTFSDLRVAMEDIGDRADRVTTVFVTADPQRDTAEVMDRYVGSFLDRYDVVRVDDPSELDAVEGPFQATTSVGPVEPDGTYEVSHSAVVYAVDADGLVQVEWPFGTEPDAFAHDLRLLLD